MRHLYKGLQTYQPGQGSREPAAAAQTPAQVRRLRAGLLPPQPCPGSAKAGLSYDGATRAGAGPRRRERMRRAGGCSSRKGRDQSQHDLQ